jgi:drug/metabolite transporter (DMT)-like permease
MGSNLAVLLLNKLLLSFWSFRQPVLLTLLHMLSQGGLAWGLAGAKLLSVQQIQSTRQLYKIGGLSFVFALAVLCANVSLKYLAVSMNQAIGAATPVFAALFAFLIQGEFCCAGIYCICASPPLSDQQALHASFYQAGRI